MGKPAARIGDSYSCPIDIPQKHPGGKIIGPDQRSVMIGGKPAALKGDKCFCHNPPDNIISASCNVLILGRHAVRRGDLCSNGGRIKSKCDTVLIGGTFHLPPPAKRVIMINLAIYDAVGLLKKKLKLLKKKDAVTMQQFEKWFGYTDYRSKVRIAQRIKRQLKLMKKMSDSHFRIIGYEVFRKTDAANIQKDVKTHTIYLGDDFWDAGRIGKDSKSGILIHELSHYKHIGKTEDHAFHENGCLSLAVKYPDAALYNADSYEYFIES
jgi:uncharacterized Zn-binding protein involved in type VI secretion